MTGSVREAKNQAPNSCEVRAAAPPLHPVDPRAIDGGRDVRRRMKLPDRAELDAETAETILVNQLTVGSALHLVKCEGGALSAAGLASRASTALIVYAFMARAIVVGEASVWHLFLPMAAEYLVLLLAHPLLVVFVQDAGLRHDAARSLAWIAAISVAAVAWIAWQSLEEGTAWSSQGAHELERFRQWIAGHGMLWAIAAAAASTALSLPGRVVSFHRNGPPFLAVGIGCAMRFVVAFFGCFLLPLLVANPGSAKWAVWALLLFSELGGLAMHWDLQRRLAERGIPV